MILMKILWLIDSSSFEVKTAKMQLNSCWTMEQMQIPNITLETTRKCLLTTFFINDFRIAICDFEQLEIQYSLKKIFKLLETKSRITLYRFVLKFPALCSKSEWGGWHIGTFTEIWCQCRCFEWWRGDTIVLCHQVQQQVCSFHSYWQKGKLQAQK